VLEVIVGLPSDIIDSRDGHGSKLGNLIRRLGSNNDSELLATVHALRRVLKSVGADLHALAEHIEKPNGSGLNEAEARKIFDTGYAMGVQDAENKQHGANDFRPTDGKPEWNDVALFLQRNKARLDAKHHEFIDDMASRTVWGREPTERQHKYLHSLFFKLGGKITS
jgi:hypothetical protein